MVDGSEDCDNTRVVRDRCDAVGVRCECIGVSGTGCLHASSGNS